MVIAAFLLWRVGIACGIVQSRGGDGGFE